MSSPTVTFALAADPNSGGDPTIAPDWVVAIYADNYFQFDWSRRVVWLTTIIRAETSWRR